VFDLVDVVLSCVCCGLADLPLKESYQLPIRFIVSQLILNDYWPVNIEK
jgi:hypothetical protein